MSIKQNFNLEWGFQIMEFVIFIYMIKISVKTRSSSYLL